MAAGKAAAASTPLRQLPFTEVEGCRVLSDAGITYVDGGESRVLEIIGSARQLGALSDELEHACSTWPELYHLAKARANVLRPFPLGSDLTVLEVGGGCGPLTRYLGDAGGAVDMLEPVLARARVARARCRDLPNVQVFVGRSEDLPARPAYDLVVVVGVLEYVGDGSGDAAPYVQFLARLASVLRPGGRIICAIENRLGVKYLAGSPEDHTGRVFDSIEGYPRGGDARTFSRRRLTALFRRAGLQPRFFHAFPDYKLPRVVFSDELLVFPEGRSLAVRLPRFPSPDRAGPRPHLAGERRLWASLVHAGLGGHFSNSFVVVASSGRREPPWEPGLLAAFFNTERRAAFCTHTRVRRGRHGLRLERSLLDRSGRRAESGPLRLQVANTDYVSGIDFVDVVAVPKEHDVQPLLQAWLNLVRDAAPASGGGPTPIDLVPHNLVLRPGGDLAVVDQEWWHREYRAQDIVERGLLWLAVHLAHAGVSRRHEFERVADLAQSLAATAGLGDSRWLLRAVRREAELQAHVGRCDPEHPAWRSAVSQVRRDVEDLMARRLADMPLGEREHDRRAAIEALADAAEERAAEAAAALAAIQAELATVRSALEETGLALEETGLALEETGLALEETRRELSAVRSSLGYRMLQSYRQAVRRLFPERSRRGLPYRALRRAARAVMNAFSRADRPS